MRAFDYRAKYMESANTTLLFVTIFLPVALLLFSLAVDIESYFRETRAAQELVDDAALFGYRFFPRSALAKDRTEAYLRGRSAKGRTTVSAGFDTLHVQYEGRVPLSFISYFGFKTAFPILVSSSAQGVPKDILILLDTASYLTPAVVGGSAWGDVADWPAATYFSMAKKVNASGAALDPRLLTQQCFNSYFSELKLVALGLYRALSSFHLNAVGVGFFPIVRNGLDLARPVYSLSEQRVGEADFLDFGNEFVSSHECFAASDAEVQTSHYKVPGRTSEFPGSWRAPMGRAPSPIDPLTKGFNPDYRPFLSVDEAVWSQAARPADFQDTRLLFEFIRTSLYGVPALSARRSLQSKAPKLAFVVTGALPSIGGRRFGTDSSVASQLIAEIAEMNEALQSSSVDYSRNQEGLRAVLYYVLLRKVGESADDTEGDFAEFLGQHSTQNLSLRFISGVSSPELTTALVRSVVAEGGGTLLAR